ncbi:hypothetical protein [Streptomyces cyaneofuscatus]|uniref:hypothetical protein n=1 Tax=Streptomyces cyaneofuscatus TaxID=66883 RepID=UPI0033BEA443
MQSSSKEYYGVQVQWDNNPGSGAQAWIWLYGGTAGGSVEYQGYNGQSSKISASGGQAVSSQPSWDIWRVKICATGKGCSGWS